MMKLSKQKQILDLALSEKETTVEELRNELIEILLDDVKPLDLIRIISGEKTKWATEPLNPQVRTKRFSITEALMNERSKK